MFYRAIKAGLKNKMLDIIAPSRFYWEQPGHCPCCDRDTVFVARHQWLRDQFQCTNCWCIPRERALMVTIEKHFPNWKALSIHESSPIDKGASKKLKDNCRHYTVSQYFPNEPFGSLVNGVHNEDLEAQTFADESFDLVITQDVFEHLYAPAKAFKEIARTLKKGGAHIFTVPIINRFQPTEVWASKGAHGEPVFLKDPEWHANPVDAKGSPVTIHWGYDIVDFIKVHSGLTTSIEYIDDLSKGIRAEFREVLVSKKM